MSKVCIVGGTGLLGFHAAKEFIEKGYDIKIFTLKAPVENLFEKEVEFVVGNIFSMSENKIVEHFSQCENVILACGADDRTTPKAPALEFFREKNVDEIRRLMRIANLSGVKKCVLLGSYFTHFNREFKELELEKVHPYIKSRVEQQEMAINFNSNKMKVVVLELPYIFGTVANQKPLWTIILDQIDQFKTVFYTKGGTTMVTAKQVGQAILGAVENVKSGIYLVAGENLLWTEWLKIILEAKGEQNRKIVIAPKWMAKIAMKIRMKKEKKQGLEGGLNFVKYLDFQVKNSFADKKSCQDALKYEDDDLKAAIVETIKKCYEK